MAESLRGWALEKQGYKTKIVSISLLLLTFHSPLFSSPAEEVLQKAGLDPSHLVQNVKSAVCQSPSLMKQFDGITVSGGVALSKGVFSFGGELEFGLFIDRVHRRILGHIFVIPRAGIARPGGKAEIQVGTIFGCKGDPHNYGGYVATASAFGLSLNLGISDAVFDRIGAKVAGVDLSKHAPVSYQAAISKVRQSAYSIASDLNGIERRKKSLTYQVMGLKDFEFESVDAEAEKRITIPFSKALNEFHRYTQTNATTAESYLEQIAKYRSYIDRLSKLPADEKTLYAASAQAEYLALEESLQLHTHRLAKIAVLLRKYSPNRPLDHYLFKPERFSKESEGGFLGIGSTKYYRDRVTGERLTVEEYNARKSGLAQISHWIDKTYEHIEGIRSLRFIIGNDLTNFKQGVAFAPNPSVGGIHVRKEVLSGCNSVTMNPKVFMHSGAPLLLAMGEFQTRLALEQVARISEVKAKLLRPEDLDRFRKATKSAMHHVDASVSLGYYYTPTEIEKLYGINVAKVTGDLEFEIPVPDSLKELLLGPEELCGTPHGGGGAPSTH